MAFGVLGFFDHEIVILTQVIVAESEANAQRIYRALGFEEHSISQALQMKPKTEVYAAIGSVTRRSISA
jgi:hypothetical protein